MLFKKIVCKVNKGSFGRKKKSMSMIIAKGSYKKG
jgi:hypothetical protein